MVFVGLKSFCYSCGLIPLSQKQSQIPIGILVPTNRQTILWFQFFANVIVPIHIMRYNLFLKGLIDFLNVAFICSSFAPSSAIRTFEMYFCLRKFYVFESFNAFLLL